MDVLVAGASAAVGSTTTIVVVGATATALAYVALAAIVILAVVALGEGDPVADVERYVELNAAARRTVPQGPALSDPDGEASAAIGRFLAEKEEARQALWASRRGTAEPQHTTTRTKEGTACVSSSPERAAPSAAASFPG